ncbi:MAG: carboxypeptidase regulatory-like domain-containing protein [Phycisphaerales bacterium]|nr:MAG: carboxypeptidase regulatory-like domain-containing protein [Phycisphaerales bacterium]
MQSVSKSPNTVSTRESFFGKVQMAAWAVIGLMLLLAQQPFVIRSVAAEQKMSGPAKFTLSVVDKKTGEPLPNVEVTVSLSGKGISDEQRKRQLTADAKGFCAVVFPVPSPEYVRFYIRAAGYVPSSASWSNSTRKPDPIPESFVFPLEKGTSIGGLVKNEEGEPVEGVKVHFLLPGQTGRIQFSLRDVVSTTDAQGKWRSDILPENIDGLWMNLKHPDYVTSETWNTIPVPPEKALRNFTSVMVLQSGVTLSGVVRDEKGNPIHDALVQLGSSGYSSETTQTDKQGHFTFKNCDEGELHVSIQAQGKSPEARRLLPKEIGTPLEFTLEPGNSMRIRVVDSNGAPLPDVYVIPETYQGYRNILKIDPDRPRWRAKTDEAGLLVWDSAPPEAVAYAFSKEGYAGLDEVQLIADGKEHTVTLPRPIRVVGTVTDKETREPIPTFTVVPTLDWLTGRPPYIERSQAFQAEAGRYEWETGRTDTGHYVRIEASGYLPAMSKMLRVGDSEQMTINFELEKGRNVEGVVRGTGGEPLEDTDVWMCTTTQGLYLSNGKLRRASSTLTAKTVAQGRFSFFPETDPFLLVVADDTGYAQVTQKEIAGSGQIQLEPWARIEGELLQDGKPVTGYRIRMYPVRVGNSSALHFFAQYHSTTNEKGEFIFERVAPGPVSLSPDLGPWEQSQLKSAQHIPLVAKPGDTIRLSLGTEGKSIRGKIVLPPGIERTMAWDYGVNYLVALKDGIPVPDEIKDLDFDWRRGFDDIWTGSREGRAYFQTLHKYFVKLSPDGSFRIDGVEAGKYEFVLRIYDPPRGMG